MGANGKVGAVKEVSEVEILFQQNNPIMSIE